MHSFECSNTMDDVYDNIEDYNTTKQRKLLIVFDDMVADIMSNKKFQAVKKKLFIRCRKLNISLVFISHLDKYKYLTGEDLNYKPCVVDQAKFDYSLLNKFFKED